MIVKKWVKMSRKTSAPGTRRYVRASATAAPARNERKIGVTRNSLSAFATPTSSPAARAPNQDAMMTPREKKGKATPRVPIVRPVATTSGSAW